MFSPDTFAAIAKGAGLMDVASHTSAISQVTTVIDGTYRAPFADPLGRVSSNAPTFRVTATVAAAVQRDDTLQVTASRSGLTGTFKVASKEPFDGGGDVLLVLKKP